MIIRDSGSFYLDHHLQQVIFTSWCTWLLKLQPTPLHPFIQASRMTKGAKSCMCPSFKGTSGCYAYPSSYFPLLEFSDMITPSYKQDLKCLVFLLSEQREIGRELLLRKKKLIWGNWKTLLTILNA